MTFFTGCLNAESFLPIMTGAAELAIFKSSHRHSISDIGGSHFFFEDFVMAVCA